MASDGTFRFHQVFPEEIEAVNKRRHKHGIDPVELVHEDVVPGSDPVWCPREASDLVGLALSGGGIRSAAFCLGALQALHTTDVLPRVDYLSTVSGGGYVGTSMRVGQEATGGQFPFASLLTEDETPAVQHIRDHSNYLFPNGAKDLVLNGSIYLRGLVANCVLIAPFILFPAALTIWVYDFSYRLPAEDTGLFERFFLSAWLGLGLLLALIVWGIARSFNDPHPPAGETCVRKFGRWIVSGLLLAVMVAVFAEFQPYLLRLMFNRASGQQAHPDLIAMISEWFTSFAKWLAPVAAVVAVLGRQLGEFVKSSTEATGSRAHLAAFAAKAAIYFAAFVVPIVLLAVYLNLSYWGLCINTGSYGCDRGPHWLNFIADRMPGDPRSRVAILYVDVALLCFVLAILLRPNANSLHPLYRDRLGKAFLFKPKDVLKDSEELEALHCKLSSLSSEKGPYHLINAALNIGGSRTANKRGRNADFFMFSPKYIGSKATGYVRTATVENFVPRFDLATAMAVSGAAASSNMGAQSIKPLSVTLAMLNIRLGYWMRNPNRMAKTSTFWNPWANFYFLAEMFGRLHEERKSVYLTDGGHIENLGIYELLRRRCRVIIVVDAEADREMGFGSLNTLERYALIDLGVRIELPWQTISDATRRAGRNIDEKGDTPKERGPHCAIGEISYPEGRKGILVYIKSSLTGDENDYIFHYKKRYWRFPHETTFDQMFSEEQFEAYRALGFHATYGMFDRDDQFAYINPAICLDLRQQLALLDTLFPRVKRKDDPPDQRQTFVKVLIDMEKARRKAESAPARPARTKPKPSAGSNGN